LRSTLDFEGDKVKVAKIRDGDKRWLKQRMSNLGIGDIVHFAREKKGFRVSQNDDPENIVLHRVDFNLRGAESETEIESIMRRIVEKEKSKFNPEHFVRIMSMGKIAQRARKIVRRGLQLFPPVLGKTEIKTKEEEDIEKAVESLKTQSLSGGEYRTLKDKLRWAERRSGNRLIHIRRMLNRAYRG